MRKVFIEGYILVVYMSNSLKIQMRSYSRNAGMCICIVFVRVGFTQSHVIWDTNFYRCLNAEKRKKNYINEGMGKWIDGEREREV